MDIPERIVQGDALTFRQNAGPNFGPGDGTVKLILRGPSALELDGVPAVDGWTFDVTGQQSAALMPGRYVYAIQQFKPDIPGSGAVLNISATAGQAVVQVNSGAIDSVVVGNAISCTAFSGSPKVLAVDANPYFQTLTVSTPATADADGVAMNVYGPSTTGARQTVETGQFEVALDLTRQGQGFDGRTQAERDLANVQAAMRALIDGGAVQEYTIGNRSVRKMTLSDLITLEQKLKYEVYREGRARKMKAGLGDGSNVLVRFK